MVYRRMPLTDPGRGANRFGDKLFGVFNGFDQLPAVRQIRRDRRRKRAPGSVRGGSFEKFRGKSKDLLARKQKVPRNPPPAGYLNITI